MVSTTFTGKFQETGGGKGTWSINNGTSGSYSVRNYTYSALPEGRFQVSYEEDLWDSSGSLYATLTGTYTGAQLPNTYQGEFLVIQDNNQYRWQQYYNGNFVGGGSFSSRNPVSLDASRFSTGTWQTSPTSGGGYGTWKTNQQNGYQGFYSYTGSTGTVNQGDVFLDVNSDGIFQANSDVKIGNYASVDTSANGGQQGNWALIAGSTQGFAWGGDTKTLFNITYPIVFATTTPSEIADLFLTKPGSVSGSSLLNYSLNNVNAGSWSGTVALNLVAKAADSGQTLEARQIDSDSSGNTGSVLQGGRGADQLWGKAGWDLLDGGAGNDLIRAGNGRDIITGGLGADELHGDFGWNTFRSEQDGFTDLIAIKSDQFLSNWIYGKAGNNPNGEKADIIEGLDANDQIKIIGVFTPDISVRAGATAHGVTGIGIYAGGALEALYTGTNLSVAQITAMTTGDGSATAMANQISSYGWTGV